MLKAFESLVKKKKFTIDNKQEKLIIKLEELRNSLLSNKKSKNLYIYGGVGCGKTMLMDLFHQSLSLKSLRVHWIKLSNILLKEHHLFTTNKHNNLIKSDYHFEISMLIQKKYGRILCIDEVQMPDIGFASLLSPILKQFILNEGFIVATSNRHPTSLVDKINDYEDLSKLFIHHFDIFQLDTIDYRSFNVSDDKQIFYSISPENRFIIKKFIEENKIYFPFDVKEKIVRIEINKRILKITELSCGVIGLDFNEIIQKNFGTVDFLKLGAHFHTFFIYNLKKLDMSLDINNIKRFMNLIDILYDFKRKVFLSGNCPLNDLFSGLDIDNDVTDKDSYGVGNEQFSLVRIKFKQF